MDFVEGDLLTVEHDPDRALVGPNLALLHSHSPETPPGAEDWNEFIEHDQIRELVVVDRSRIYTLEKPEEWTVQQAIGTDARVAGGQFDIQSRRIEQTYLQHPDLSLTADQAVHQIISRTNRYMAQLYKVQYREEPQ